MTGFRFMGCDKWTLIQDCSAYIAFYRLDHDPCIIGVMTPCCKDDNDDDDENDLV